MKTLIFAATKKQKSYFTQLKSKLDGNVVLLWYKDLWRPLTSRFSPQEKHRLKLGIQKILDQKILEAQQNLQASNAHSRSSHLPTTRWRNTLILSALRFFKTLESQWIYRIYFRAIQEQKPQLIIIWNGLKFRQRLFLLAAKESNISHVLFFENGLLPNTTTADFKGVNYRNSVPRDPLFYREYAQNKGALNLPDFFSNRQDNSLSTPGHMNSNIERLPEQYIFVPFQVNSDSQITLFSPWIQHMQELYSHIVQAKSLIQNQDLHFIFKRHPSCSEPYHDLLNHPVERCHFMDELPTDLLIKHATAVITINSTVGLESLLLNKKVISLGQAFYNISGLTLQANSLNALVGRIDMLPEWQLNPALCNAFLHYVYYQYAIPQAWQDPNDKHWSGIKRLIRQHLWLSHQQPMSRKILDVIPS